MDNSDELGFNIYVSKKESIFDKAQKQVFEVLDGSIGNTRYDLGQALETPIRVVEKGLVRAMDFKNKVVSSNLGSVVKNLNAVPREIVKNKVSEVVYGTILSSVFRNVDIKYNRDGSSMSIEQK